MNEISLKNNIKSKNNKNNTNNTNNANKITNKVKNNNYFHTPLDFKIGRAHV